jgi:hypothetical protein
VIQLKDDDLGSGSGKRRRIKRDHLPGTDGPVSFSSAAAPLLPGPAPPYEGRDRDKRSGALPARGPPYMDEVPYEKGPSSARSHGKDGSKVSRREHEQSFDRADWDEEKRPRAEVKSRRHHRK